MKKLLALLLCFTMLFALVGCGGAAEPAADPAGETNNGEAGGNEVAASEFSIYLCGATPGGGGVWDMVGAGVAETIMKSNDKCYVTVTPGGGVSDVPVVSNNEAELGLTHNCMVTAALEGIDPFDQVYSNVKGICALYPSMFQFITKAGYCQSIKDIVDNKMPIRLAVGDPGSTGELGTKRLLEAYGASYEDVESWGGQIVYKDMSEAATMLGDGLIDALTLWTLAPAGPVQQIAVSMDLQILGVDEDILAKMNSEFGYSVLDITKDAYDFMGADIKTMGSKVVVIANDEMAENDAYNIVRSLCENIDYLQSIHSNLAPLTTEEMANTDTPLHPGAEKYYKEIGVL